MSRSFLQYDVFTEELLTGNQLAVFVDARGLAADRMQALAREMNFSESTFILPPETAGTDVRIASRSDEIVEVKVGGQVVLVGRGELLV